MISKLLFLPLAFSAAFALCAQEAKPARTKLIDAKSLERAPLVTNAAPAEAALKGEWDLWVPGGVWYSSDGRTVYQHYTPGAAINRLVIQDGGKYEWGQKKGSLAEVRPWHAQEGRRYYRIDRGGGAEYDLYLSPEGKLVLLFGGVGGHAATGTRIEKESAPSAPTKTPTHAAYTNGQKVEVLWSGRWYPATITKTENERWFIHYEGWDASWDEWVKTERIRLPAKTSSKK